MMMPLFKKQFNEKDSITGGVGGRGETMQMTYQEITALYIEIRF